jgi:hypothetical protein
MLRSMVRLAWRWRHIMPVWRSAYRRNREEVVSW